jgi:Holliday junction resolvase
MSINARQKGARCEREAAKYLTDLGFPCSRNGRNGYSADDLCTPFKWVHVEVKADQSIGLGTKALRDACEQAFIAAMSRPRWCVLWKEDRKGWRLSFCSAPGWYPAEILTVAGDEGIRLTLERLEAP